MHGFYNSGCVAAGWSWSLGPRKNNSACVAGADFWCFGLLYLPRILDWFDFIAFLVAMVSRALVLDGMFYGAGLVLAGVA